MAANGQGGAAEQQAAHHMTPVQGNAVHGLSPYATARFIRAYPIFGSFCRKVTGTGHGGSRYRLVPQPVQETNFYG
jgi:hypothetical protein